MVQAISDMTSIRGNWRQHRSLQFMWLGVTLIVRCYSCGKQIWKRYFSMWCFFVAFGVGVCWLHITRQSKFMYKQWESSVFSPVRRESYVVVGFSTHPLSHNLEQAVPCLIHSSGLSDAFRYHPSSIFVHRFTGPKKVVFRIFRYCLVLSWGQWTNGLWTVEFTPVFSPSLGQLLRPPDGADNNRLRMKYVPWPGHSSEQSICSQQFRRWIKKPALIEGKYRTPMLPGIQNKSVFCYWMVASLLDI